MEFIRSQLWRDHTTATEVLEKDLPTGALSHLILSMDGYNVTDEATLAEILAFINAVEVTRSGVTVLSLESEDLYGVNMYLYKHFPELTGKVATDDYARNLGLIIPFGRRIFDPDECYPPTKKGDLTLRVNFTVPAASLDNSTVNIETVELVGAQPTHFMRSTLLTVVAPGATGDNDVELPIGNEIICVQMRLTTIPGASSHTYGVDNARILVNDREFGYAAARAQCLQADRVFRVDGQHSTIGAQGVDQSDNVLWLDFDPAGDGRFLLDTKGRSSVKLRLNMGVDEATKVTLLERVAV